MESEQITTGFVEGIPVIDIDGELDHQTIPVFRAQIAALIDRGYKDVVIDMSDVTFMDSGGMSGIIFAVKRFSDKHGQVFLAACTDRVTRKLEIGGLTRLSGKLRLVPSVQQAVVELK